MQLQSCNPAILQSCHPAILQVVDVKLMAEAMEYCATQGACRNQAFNLSNGDVFRWTEVSAGPRCAWLWQLWW